MFLNVYLLFLQQNTLPGSLRGTQVKISCLLRFWLYHHVSYVDSIFTFCKVFTVQLAPEANDAEGDRKEEEAGWVEWEMNTVYCGAVFAMLKKH